MSILVFGGSFFQKIGQNGRPGPREAHQSVSFDEISRIKSVWARLNFETFLFMFCKTTSARQWFFLNILFSFSFLLFVFLFAVMLLIVVGKS